MKEKRLNYLPNYPIFKKIMDAYEYISKLKNYFKTFKVDKKYWNEIIFKGCDIKDPKVQRNVM